MITIGKDLLCPEATTSIRFVNSCRLLWIWILLQIDWPEFWKKKKCLFARSRPPLEDTDTSPHSSPDAGLWLRLWPLWVFSGGVHFGHFSGRFFVPRSDWHMWHVLSMYDVPMILNVNSNDFGWKEVQKFFWFILVELGKLKGGDGSGQCSNRSALSWTLTPTHTPESLNETLVLILYSIMF